MADGKPKTISGYNAAQTGLAERTLVTVWRHIGEYREHLVLIGGLVPRYLVDKVTERDVPPGAGHCGTMDVDLGISLAVTDLKTYESIRDRLINQVRFQRGENDAGKKQKHSFVSTIDGQDINIDFLTTKYEGPESTIREVEDDLSAIQVEGLGLALTDPVIVNIRAELLTGDGSYTAEVPICRAVPYVVLKALAFSERGERKDAYDLVYTLINHEDGAEAVAREVRDEERNARSFKHAVAEMEKLFASENDNGPVACGNFLSDPVQIAVAYAAVQEFLTCVR
jgi:hypothetical protein